MFFNIVSVILFKVFWIKYDMSHKIGRDTIQRLLKYIFNYLDSYLGLQIVAGLIMPEMLEAGEIH